MGDLFEENRPERDAWANLARAESMDVTNDPRFMGNNVIAKRLVAFQTYTIVCVFMVNLSLKQVFLLEKSKKWEMSVDCVVQYTGFMIMICVFVANLFAVVVIVQQLFQAYRLLTAGTSGFEAAKSYYLNENIVMFRHLAVKAFLYGLPWFTASTGCMVWVSMPKHHEYAAPVCAYLFLCAIFFAYVNWKHRVIFVERYKLAKQHEMPLANHMQKFTMRTGGQRGGFLNMDV